MSQLPLNQQYQARTYKKIHHPDKHVTKLHAPAATMSFPAIVALP